MFGESIQSNAQMLFRCRFRYLYLQYVLQIIYSGYHFRNAFPSVMIKVTGNKADGWLFTAVIKIFFDLYKNFRYPSHRKMLATGFISVVQQGGIHALIHAYQRL